MAEETVIVGIDEAGRGPVCGPLVYGIAWMPARLYDERRLRALGVDDSKRLSAQERERVFERLQALEGFSYETRTISAHAISTAMLSPRRRSINALSFEAARSLLHEVYQSHPIEHAYIDLVSPEAQYAAAIRELMPNVTLTICAKADAKYAITGAASIVAKVRRDRDILPTWGSGYPSDPITIKYLTTVCNPIYGFPNHVRHSWQTIQTIYEDKQRCKRCHFLADSPLIEQPTPLLHLGLVDEML
ncbi:Ribonuclease HI, large sub [Giardia muris]|uniref:Ribonuclease n=1 Tax=Giardia muris TaxID=5742 RepID=A0A4Z1STB2_GIAMU|nr:Ribonuclease HI, large sub [Giardia muris]|eukprot:TNJ29166.1 Ribonuclease HI, large sub [Giardia muris]